ncbi:hypothetical protein [Streptomyces sp. NPDC017993]|uniref:hypothetical protein n=1 Tax=Streptomyces sp. NPDC017993 TaxID=3365027 RepID=UPI003798750F
MRNAATNPLDEDHDVAGNARAPWCQRAAAHIAELQGQLNRIRKIGLDPCDEEVAKKADTHLRAARHATGSKASAWSKFTGAAVDRASANIHRAEVKLLHLASEDDLTWRGAVVLAQARQHLGRSDPRLQLLEERLQNTGHELKPPLRELAVSTLLAAHDAEETERAKVRSFRNILLSSVVATGVIAGIFVMWGFLDPSVIPPNLCFEGGACPVGGKPGGTDVLLVEVAGLGAAALAGAVSIRFIQGTAMPYSVPMMLVLLRLPIGALAALLGILLIHGEFIPGLTNLDNGPQIIAWAIAFGILQESVTRMVDRQGKAVLNNVRGSERGFEKPARGPEAQP